MNAHRLLSGLLICLLIGFGLQDCSEKKEAANEHLVRGLRTYKVAARAQVEQANAGVQQAQATVDNAEGDFQRKLELLKKGITTQAAFDQKARRMFGASVRFLTVEVASS